MALDEIPIDPSRAAILIGIAVVAIAVLVGVLFSRRAVKDADPNDVLRGP